MLDTLVGNTRALNCGLLGNVLVEKEKSRYPEIEEFILVEGTSQSHESRQL